MLKKDKFIEILKVTNKNNMQKEKILKAEFGSDKTPLELGALKINCYVLEDGRSVLSGRGIDNVLANGSNKNFPRITTRKFFKSKLFTGKFNKELIEQAENPIKFSQGNLKNLAYGYEATFLVDFCNEFIDLSDNGELETKYEPIIKICRIVTRAVSKVGIIALVHEATGYQEIRHKYALQEILKKFISKELLSWQKRFPNDYYKETFRLLGWEYNPLSVKRPGVLGKITNKYIYELLPPGVLDELRKKNPMTKKGYRKHRHHQYLTQDIGHPKLKEHIDKYITIAKLSKDWDDFKIKFKIVFKKEIKEINEFNNHGQMIFDYAEGDVFSE